MVTANATPGEVHGIKFRNLEYESGEHIPRSCSLWIDKNGRPVAELRAFPENARLMRAG